MKLSILDFGNGVRSPVNSEPPGMLCRMALFVAGSGALSMSVPVSIRISTTEPGNQNSRKKRALRTDRVLLVATACNIESKAFDSVKWNEDPSFLVGTKSLRQRTWLVIDAWN